MGRRPRTIRRTSTGRAPPGATYAVSRRAGRISSFLTEGEGDERIRAGYRKNYERLVEIKTKWDRENLFRMNKNIKPSV